MTVLLYLYGYVYKSEWVTKLNCHADHSNQPAGVTPEVTLRKPWHTGDEHTSEGYTNIIKSPRNGLLKNNEK